MDRAHAFQTQRCSPSSGTVAEFRVKNWSEYEAGLRQRGSITFWTSEAAISGWLPPRRTTPGGQSRYSDLAIETSFLCGIVFHQPLRRTEGLMSSLLQLMGLDLPVPDHTTLSRRCSSLSLSKALVRHKTTAPDEPIHVLIDKTGLKIYGAGQWLEEKYGFKCPRKRRKLHLAVDADRGEIIAEVLPDQNSSDISQITDLLERFCHVKFLWPEMSAARRSSGDTGRKFRAI